MEWWFSQLVVLRQKHTLERIFYTTYIFLVKDQFCILPCRCYSFYTEQIENVFEVWKKYSVGCDTKHTTRDNLSRIQMF